MTPMAIPLRHNGNGRQMKDKPRRDARGIDFLATISPASGTELIDLPDARRCGVSFVVMFA